MALNRWMYAGHHPNWLAKTLNRAGAAMYAAGIMPNYAVTLEVVGRKSGKVIRFPLVMAVVDGERYLVSMLGKDVNWVRNVEAAQGRATLRHGRTEQVVMEPVPVEGRAPILKAYLQRAPGARAHIAVSKDAPAADFEPIAAEYPVYRVKAVDEPRTEPKTQAGGA